MDPVKVLQDLGLNEYVSYAYEIAKELEKDGYLEILTDGTGKVLIEGFTLKAKYFIGDYKKNSIEIENKKMSKNSKKK